MQSGYAFRGLFACEEEMIIILKTEQGPMRSFFFFLEILVLLQEGKKNTDSHYW